jgi:hypothetical protein
MEQIWTQEKGQENLGNYCTNPFIGPLLKGFIIEDM